MAENVQDGRHQLSYNTSFAVDGSKWSKVLFGEWVIYLNTWKVQLMILILQECSDHSHVVTNFQHILSFTMKIRADSQVG